MDLQTLKAKMDECHYIYDETLATVLYVALQLGRPLLIEGAAGVGKTEIAKVMAAALGRDLVRLQCYEGLDESKALYEWNYQKQLLSIQVNMNETDKDALTRSLFSDEYLLERPLLQSIRSEKPVVLLIDEIDKADLEFPNDLLWELDRMEFHIPETGKTISAKHRPVVIITSNAEKELPDAFLRRCVFHYIDFPDKALMEQIVRVHYPDIDDALLTQVLEAFYKIRNLPQIKKKPSTSELLDWLQALRLGGVDPEKIEEELPYAGILLKKTEDLTAVKNAKSRVKNGYRW